MALSYHNTIRCHNPGDCDLDLHCHDNLKSHIWWWWWWILTRVWWCCRVSELTMQRIVQPWLHPKVFFDMTTMGKRYAQCLNVLHGFTNKVSLYTYAVHNIRWKHMFPQLKPWKSVLQITRTKIRSSVVSTPTSHLRSHVFSFGLKTVILTGFSAFSVLSRKWFFSIHYL